MIRPSLTPSVLVLAFALSACASTAVMPAPAPEFANTVPEDIEAAIRMAQMQRSAGNFQGATATLGQLVLVSPNNPRVLGEYGKTLVDKGDTTDALAFLQRAIELEPGEWSYLSAQGVAYAQRGEYASAQAAFTRALALNPGAPPVLNNMALTHLQQGNLDRAEALLHQASANGAAYPKIAQNLALVQQLKAGQSNTPANVPVQAPAPGDVPAQGPVAAVETLTAAPVEVAVIEPPAAPVTVAAVTPPPPTPAEISAPPAPAVAQSDLPLPASGPIYLQIGAFASEENAERVSERLADLNPHTIPTRTGARLLHRVSVGPFADAGAARTALTELSALGIEDVQVLTRLPTAASSSAPTPSVPALKQEPESQPQTPSSPQSLPDLRFSETL